MTRRRKHRKAIHRKGRRKGLAPLLLGVIVRKDKVVVVLRTKKRKGKGGVKLDWGFPGGKKWNAFGILPETERECGAEIGKKVRARHIIGSRHHPQFPRRMVYYVFCQLISDAPLEKLKFKPGRNIIDVRLVTPREFVTLCKVDIFPPVAGFLGLTTEEIAKIRAEVIHVDNKAGVKSPAMVSAK